MCHVVHTSQYVQKAPSMNTIMSMYTFAGVQGHKTGGQSIQRPWPEAVPQPASAACLNAVDAWQHEREPGSNAS